MNNVHFAIPEIYGESLSYYEVLRKLTDKMNEMIENYNTVPEQIAEAVANLDASQLFSAVLEQIIDSIATDNTKSANAAKVYKKHDLLYATFNETVNLYESLIDFTTGTETELIPGTNIREVNISELFIELRELITDETHTREQADTNLQTKIEQLKTYVTPEMFGAVGDGVHDDTNAIQTALLSDNVFFPEGTYLVKTNDSERISVPSNRILLFHKNAKLKGINENKSTGSILLLLNVNNVSINGGNFEGDVLENTNEAEGANNGIYISGSNNIVISDCHFTNCFTDGIYSIGVNNLLIDNCTFYHMGRSAAGCTGGENVTIRNCVANDIFRASPKSGFDCEPNFATDKAKNITIDNCTVSNAALPFYIRLANLGTEKHDINVKFLNCTSIDCQYGFQLGDFNPTTNQSGSIIIDNLTVIRSKQTPFNIVSYNKENTPIVKVSNFNFIDGNQNNEPDAYGSAICVSGSNVGNIEFHNGHLESSDGKMPLRISDVIDAVVSNVNVIDIAKDRVKYIGDFPSADMNIETSGAYGITGYNIYIGGDYTEAAFRKHTLNDKKIYTIKSTANTRCVISFENPILGFYTSGRIYSDTKNACLVLKKLDSDNFILISKYGDWNNL